MIWFIADTHFGHANIIEYENRSFESVEEMDFAMISRWNDTVRSKDIVYHLGDFSLSENRNIAHMLNGNKILIVGNHDGSPRAMERQGFVAALESATIRIDHHTFFLSHHPDPSPEEGVWNLHGHVHSKWKAIPNQRRICMSVENWGYAPVSYREIVKEIKRFGGSNE